MMSVIQPQGALIGETRNGALAGEGRVEFGRSRRCRRSCLKKPATNSRMAAKKISPRSHVLPPARLPRAPVVRSSCGRYVMVNFRSRIGGPAPPKLDPFRSARPRRDHPQVGGIGAGRDWRARKPGVRLPHDDHVAGVRVCWAGQLGYRHSRPGLGQRRIRRTGRARCIPAAETGDKPCNVMVPRSAGHASAAVMGRNQLPRCPQVCCSVNLTHRGSSHPALTGWFVGQPCPSPFLAITRPGYITRSG